MARPIKQGIEYFSLDTDFFSERKIKKIIIACGASAPSVLICLLCNIYKDKGYYIVWDSELPFDIADIVGVSEGQVTEVVKKALQVGFFDQEQFEKHKILTSHGIQQRFKASTERRKEVEIIEEFWINVCNNPINVCNNPINVCNNEQSKVKETKVKKSSIPPKPIKIPFHEEKKQASKKMEFKPPELHDVLNFFEDSGLKNWKEEAEMFFLHYDSLGWKTVTGAKVVNWDSMANKWILTEKQKNDGKNKRGTGPDGKQKVEYGKL